MPYTVLRIQKLKTWGAIAGTDRHNARERDTPNADQERSAENTVLMGTPEKDAHDAIKDTLANHRIRKNAVLAVEMLLSASPEYFRPHAPEQAGSYDKERLQAWTEATTQWLQKRYGNRIKKATLHVDEATPHIHAVMVPLDERGKLNCRALFGGTRQTLSDLQSDYAQAVAHLGINRGIQNSRATHQKVSQFYSLVQAKNTQDLPVPQNCAQPDMPNKVMRMSDERLTQYAQQAASNGAKAQREALIPLVAATQSQNVLLKQENQRLKKANSQLTKEKSELQKQMEQLRGLTLGTVLQTLFRAKGPYPALDGKNRYILPDKQEVLVDSSKWAISNGKRGKGAIDLVMAMRGYEQADLSKAVAELAHAFGVEKATGEYAAKTAENAALFVQTAARKFEPAPQLEKAQRQRR